MTVFFDGGCPLCSREIAHYRRLDTRQYILWVDVTRDEAGLETHGITPTEAMASFHVLDDHGRLVKGADAFVALWQKLPYYRWLAQLCRVLHLLPVMRWGYDHFARWHFRRRCQAGACALEQKPHIHKNG